MKTETRKVIAQTAYDHFNGLFELTFNYSGIKYLVTGMNPKKTGKQLFLREIKANNDLGDSWKKTVSDNEVLIAEYPADSIFLEKV